MKKILTILILFIACKSERVIDITGQCEFYGCGYLGLCFGNYENEIIIRDQESFQSVGDLIRHRIINLDCDTAVLPYVDFEKYSLAGKYTEGMGCGCNYNRKVINDQKERRIIYEIENVYYGNCKLLIVDMNWALIPKIPNDYTVKFIMK